MNKNIKNKYLLGCSMIEIISVLALIGLLSMLGLVGYKFLMNDYRANETIYDVMLRASNVPMIWEDFEDKDKWAGEEYVLSDLEPENPLNYPVVIEGEPPESPYVFRVDVMDVPSEVCERIISKMPKSIDLIKVGNDAGPNPSSDNANAMDCYLDETTLIDMSFYFYSAEYEETDIDDDIDDDEYEDECDTCSECEICVNGVCQNKTDGSSCSNNGCCENGVCGTCKSTQKTCGESNPCTEVCSVCSADGVCIQAAFGTSCDGGNCNEMGVCCEQLYLTSADCAEECKTLTTQNGCPVCSGGCSGNNNICSLGKCVECVNDTDCSQNEVCGTAGQCCPAAKSSCAIDKDETDLTTGCIIRSKKNCEVGTVCNLETGECDDAKVCDTIKNCMEYDASCSCKTCNIGYVLSNGGSCVAENRNCTGGTWLTGKNGDKFCLNNTGSSWDKAKAWCESLGMSLASAKSACAANVKNCICDNAGLGDCSVGCCVNFTGIKHPNTSDSVLMWLTDIDCSNNKGEIIPCEEANTHYLVDLGSGRINTFSGWMNLSYALCE